jgi:heptosyltransferase III
MKKKKYCGNRPAKLRFIIIDFFVDNFLRIIGSKKNKSFVNPQRVLLFNYGHLGDMLMMGYMINVLKIKYPKVETHLVVGRWCKVLIENNPLYDKIHYFNHYRNDRQNIPFLEKYVRHFKDIFFVMRELRKNQYSHSFDFRYSAYNANQMLPFLNIEQKNGFGSRGLGSLLDNEFYILSDESHTIDTQAQVLKSINVDINSKELQPNLLNYFGPAEMPPVGNKFIIIFPEAGNPERMLGLDFWVKIADEILSKMPNHQLIICGITDFNKKLSNSLSDKYVGKIIDATKTFSIIQIATLLDNADGAITLDSFPAHLASINTKTISFFKNASGNEYFPINSRHLHIIHDNEKVKSATAFRENMRVDFVESFQSNDFQSIFTIAIKSIMAHQD